MRSIRKKYAMEFDIAFTNKEITPWGGMAFLSQFLNKIGFREQVDTCSALPIQGSNRGHNVADLLEAFTASVWCGANRLCIPKLHGMMPLYALFLVGRMYLDKMPTNDILANLIKQQTLQLVNIFILG
jgi:hypothetical protein